MAQLSDDEELCAEICRSVVLNMDQLYPPGVSPVRRDAHPKTHGCVRAELQVEPDLPEDLCHGLFRTPKKYDAWIRFSAGSPRIQNDCRPDIHGMAIKVLGVPGQKLLQEEQNATTQDFLLANNPVYFIRDLPDYVRFASAVASGKLLRFFFNWNPSKWRIRESKLLVTANLHRMRNPLTAQYWSQTPYALGPHVIKFSAKPICASVAMHAQCKGPDFLQNAMVTLLQEGDVNFDFLVQLQTNPKTMPVNDATVNWDERESPFRKVASVHIPRQSFGSMAQMAFAENLSFTPWHALVDHRPLGGINRARLSVYQSVSRIRHERNGEVREEPTSFDVPLAKS